MLWLIVIALVLLGMILIKFKEFKHRFAFFVVVLIVLFMVVSSFSIFRNHDVNVSSFDGVVTLGKLYVASFVNIFRNMGDVTMHAIRQDWDVSTREANFSLG